MRHNSSRSREAVASRRAASSYRLHAASSYAVRRERGAIHPRRAQGQAIDLLLLEEHQHLQRLPDPPRTGEQLGEEPIGTGDRSRVASLQLSREGAAVAKPLVDS
jgi:hypothetical protein